MTLWNCKLLYLELGGKVWLSIVCLAFGFADIPLGSWRILPFLFSFVLAISATVDIAGIAESHSSQFTDSTKEATL